MSHAPLYFIVIAAVLAVLVILMIGLGAFTKGGAFNRKYSNKLMRLRIIAQAIVVGLIMLYAVLHGTAG